MSQKTAETKEGAEIKESGAKAAPDKKKILELVRTYPFEGEKISSLDFSGIENLTAENMIRANMIMEDSGVASTVPENTMYYALIIAAEATGIPIEFFKKLRPKDAVNVRRMVTRSFFGED